MMTVVVAATVGVVTTTAIEAPAMTTAIDALMGGAMITGLVESTATPQAARTATAAAAMIVVVVAVAVANIMVVTVDVQAMEATVTRRLQEIPASLTEVEFSRTAQTIGTLVVELRLANLLRCGALCQITAPTSASTSRHRQDPHYSEQSRYCRLFVAIFANTFSLLP